MKTGRKSKDLWDTVISDMHEAGQSTEDIVFFIAEYCKRNGYSRDMHPARATIYARVKALREQDES